MQLQSNLPKWIALGPDRERPLWLSIHYPRFMFYIVSKWDQSNDLSSYPVSA